MDNLRGSLWMILAMAAFAVEDTFIKTAAIALPVGEIIALFGLGGTAIFLGLTWARGERALVPEAARPVMLLRIGFEIGGRVFFTLSLAFTTLSATSAILQAAPLVVTLGAALVFGERVGWRRWSAIAIGFAGVLLILRPLPQSFDPASLLAVAALLGFAGRDLMTRAAPPILSRMQLGVWGFAVLIPTGAAMVAVTGGARLPQGSEALALCGAIGFGVLAYYALTAAMRMGEVAVVTPFRYTRLLFALILGAWLFGERPDLLTLAGAAVIVGSGLYTLLRQRRVPPPPAAAR
ncbi:Permease of the drug/metabolite transporter (DMT) superfamily [Salinihabitans flavidus]|uniref:Permease of the drug/metabolite transporter (DMT) superfamily n=1 Tax=Salinihabitans flavidus TaxID=569882 RepID=A0A1H8P1L4_9RHOB|nr:DMT family transporter [Salinihabitans flavidus]SEO35503.1 Permease of the drug/metabolite transporter (DMT) superfamily [Salinihabitans flavidus]